MSALRALAGPIWRRPALLALLSLFGLIAALLADGVWDLLSWAALAVPVAVCAWYGLRRR
jgi:hypothetical protein